MTIPADTYYSRRAHDAESRAETATHPAARKAHETMAELYAKRAKDFEPVSRA
ncbi:MAG: hypothetical protein V2J26_01725 [Pacificimonas sp.]|jgi:hypothetical protein|nr:hypothetical protein [Pacificimonas sp.]